MIFGIAAGSKISNPAGKSIIQTAKHPIAMIADPDMANLKDFLSIVFPFACGPAATIRPPRTGPEKPDSKCSQAQHEKSAS